MTYWYSLKCDSFGLAYWNVPCFHVSFFVGIPFECVAPLICFFTWAVFWSLTQGKMLIYAQGEAQNIRGEGLSADRLKLISIHTQAYIHIYA